MIPHMKEDHCWPKSDLNQTNIFIEIRPKSDLNVTKIDRNQTMAWYGLKTRFETKLCPSWWSQIICFHSSQDDGMCTDALITLSCTTVWKQYCTMDKLMLTQAFKIGLLSAKSDLSRTNLLQKVRLRTKVRENRTLWEHCLVWTSKHFGRG